MNIKEGRIRWIDASKGILIILVVMYHYIQSFCPDLIAFTKIVSTFFMQAFFVLSGFLINDSTPLKQFVKRKAKTLLIPYCVFCVLLLIYNILVSVLNNDIGGLLERIKETLIPTVFLCRNSFFNLLWFFPCLFSSVIAVKIVLKITKSKTLGFICVIAIAAIMYFVANKTHIILPLCLDTAGVASFWVYSGYLARQINIKTKKANITAVVAATIIFTACCIIFLSVYTSPRSYDSFRNIRYVNVFLTSVISVCATVLVIYAGKALQKITILISVGQKTDIIYGLHFMFISPLYQVFNYLYDNNTVIYQIIQVILSLVIVIVISFIVYHLKIRFQNRSKSKGCIET